MDIAEVEVLAGVPHEFNGRLSFGVNRIAIGGLVANVGHVIAVGAALRGVYDRLECIEGTVVGILRVRATEKRHSRHWHVDRVQPGNHLCGEIDTLVVVGILGHIVEIDGLCRDGRIVPGAQTGIWPLLEQRSVDIDILAQGARVVHQFVINLLHFLADFGGVPRLALIPEALAELGDASRIDQGVDLIALGKPFRMHDKQIEGDIPGKRTGDDADIAQGVGRDSGVIAGHQVLHEFFRAADLSPRGTRTNHLLLVGAAHIAGRVSSQVFAIGAGLRAEFGVADGQDVLAGRFVAEYCGRESISVVRLRSNERESIDECVGFRRRQGSAAVQPGDV